MINGDVEIVLLTVAVGVAGIALARLFLLQIQLKNLSSAVGNSLGSGTLELVSGIVNPQLQALALFVRELLSKQREGDLAKDRYQLAPQYTTDESGGALNIIEEVRKRLLTTITGLGDIVSCAILTGDSSSLDVESLYLRRGVADRRITSAMTQSAEEILFSDDHILEDKVLVSVESLGSNIRSLNEIGIKSFLLSGIRTQSVFLVLWIGVSKGLSVLNPAEEGRLREVADAVLQFMQLLNRMKHVLADERESILGMSHDLRTPGITAMYVLNDLISSPDLTLSEEVLSKIGVAERCLRDQLNGITDFIRAGKVDNGAIKPNVSTFDLCAVLLEMLSLYELHALSRSVELVADIPKSILIRSDETLFRRIISNILSNVAKYSAPGLADVSVGQVGTDIQIRIKNPVASAPFDKRLNSGDSDLSSTGLGMRVAERLALLLNGQFTFSQTEVGIVESILKLNSVAIEREPSKQSVTGVDYKGRYRRVLVIDDDDATARMHTRYVQEIAEQIDIAGSIDEALFHLGLHEYDLILSDIVFDAGPSVNTLLDSLAAAGSPTKVILVSGSLSDDILLLNDVPVPRLVKPISKSDLLDILEGQEIQRSNTRLNHSTI